ncbi:hypothetical protein K2P56_04450 [Patescibacteria group bacterium]|nr:hypothetical protein [Patescibacteria group bacterium]
MEREIMRILLANYARRRSRYVAIPPPSNVVVLARHREQRARSREVVARCPQCTRVIGSESRFMRSGTRYCSSRCATDAYRGVPPQSDD